MTTENDEMLGDYPDEAEELDLDALGWVPKAPIQDTWAEPLFWTVAATLVILVPLWVDGWLAESNGTVTPTQAQPPTTQTPATRNKVHP